MCSVHVLTYFSWFAKEVTFHPVDGCGVPPELSFSHGCWFWEQNACSLHPRLGGEAPATPLEKGWGRWGALCSVLQFADTNSAPWSPSAFSTTVLLPVHLPWGWDQGCDILKIPDTVMNSLFHLPVPLSPSVGNSPSSPFLPYAACIFSFSAHNPVRNLISLCSSVQPKIDYGHLRMVWLSFYLLPQHFSWLFWISHIPLTVLSPSSLPMLCTIGSCLFFLRQCNLL